LIPQFCWGINCSCSPGSRGYGECKMQTNKKMLIKYLCAEDAYTPHCVMNRMHIPQAALIPMTTSDINKAKELLKRPYICEQPHWSNEVKIQDVLVLSLVSDKSFFIQFFHTTIIFHYVFLSLQSPISIHSIAA